VQACWSVFLLLAKLAALATADNKTKQQTSIPTGGSTPCPRYICSTLVSFRMESRTPMGHDLIPRRLSEGSPKGLKTDEQKFRSLRALEHILVQAPIRTPCSIAVDFGADRAEIRPIGAITWRALPSSPNPSGHSAWRATHHIDEEVGAKTARHLWASRVPVAIRSSSRSASLSALGTRNHPP
jgi:hypothetical protein